MRDKMLPSVSIIIPTYHDWDRLRVLLAAIVKQEYPEKLLEVIVVNNACTAEVVPQEFDQYKQFVFLNEAKKGSYAARNAGVLAAKGDILAFTDSDCVPDRFWLSNAVKFFIENPLVSRVGGCVKIFSEAVEKKSISLIYEEISAFPQEIYIANEMAAVTANMFSRREVFEKVGLFNDQLMSGGDLEWGKRAGEAGCPIAYLKSSLVYHPARNYKEIIKKAKRTAGGFVSRKPVDKSIVAVVSMFLKGFLPPVFFIHRTALLSEYSLYEKLTAIFFRFYLRIVMHIEMTRVALGKEPER